MPFSESLSYTLSVREVFEVYIKEFAAKNDLELVGIYVDFQNDYRTLNAQVYFCFTFVKIMRSSNE